MIFLLALLALLPTILLMVFIYYKDSYEKEPVGLLAGLFVLGAVSCLPAALAEEIGDLFFAAIFESGTAYNFFYAFFVVALAEEGGKFIFTYVLTWKNKNFNYRFDGIVYCVFTSLGFATLENILYVFNGGLSVAIVRAILSVPSHAIDAVFMGYYYGQAKLYDSMGEKSDRNKCLFFAYSMAVVLHGFYDFCLFQETDGYIVIFLLFVIVIDILAFIRINRSSKQNVLIYKQYANYYGQGYAHQMYGQNYYTNNMYNSYGQQNMQQSYNTYGQPNVQQGYNSYGQYNMQQGYNTYGQQNVQQIYNSYGQNNMQQGYNTYNQSNAQQGYNSYQPNAHVTRLTQQYIYIYCMKCGNVCNANTFYCGKCGSPIHTR